MAVHKQLDVSEFTLTDYPEVISPWKSCEGVELSSADSKEIDFKNRVEAVDKADSPSEKS